VLRLSLIHIDVYKRQEATVLGVWCVYCAISLADISLITLLALGATVASLFRTSPAAPVS